MARLSSSIFLFIIITTTPLLSSGQEDSQWKTHKLITKDIWIVKAERFDNPTFAYALCKSAAASNPRRECAIVLHKDVHDNATRPVQCTFTLRNASRGIMRIENFGEDRAIFVWNHETRRNKTSLWTFRTAVIQMSSCRIGSVELVVTTKRSQFNERFWHSFHLNLLVYEDTFDVVVQRVPVCGDAENEEHCVYSYDSGGKKIGGPVTRFSPRGSKHLYEFKPMSRRSPDAGYLVTAGHKTLHVSIVKPTGNSSGEVNTTMLWKFAFDQETYSITAYARSNEMIGICNCQVQNYKLFCSCVQMNREGGSRKQIRIVVNKQPHATAVAILMHNLRGRGFFFMPLYTDSEKHFYAISKVNAEGNVVGEPLVIASHERNCLPEILNLRFVEQVVGQYCITLACIQKTETERFLKTFSECYDSSYLDRKFRGKSRSEL